MNLLNKILLVLCFVGGYSFSQAESLTPQDCLSSQTLVAKLKVLQEKIEQQSQNLTTEQQEEHLKADDDLAQWLTLITPYALKDDVLFASSYNSCWVNYRDFFDALKTQSKAKYTEKANVWKNCLLARDRVLNNASKQVFKCLSDIN